MIIGFCGAIGAGKTTAAKYLEHKHDFVRIGFAKILKDMGRAFGLTEDQLNGDRKELPDNELLCGKTPRQFMQWLGTDFGRNMIGPDLWVNAWRAQAIKHPNVVADDVRFPNEVKAIHELGGKIIRLGRNGATVATHESENQQFDADCMIHNFGSLADLAREIDRLLRL